LKRQCRQRVICGYFGEEIDDCGVCDVCREEPEFRESFEKHHAKADKLNEIKAAKSAVELNDEEQRITHRILMDHPAVFGRKILIGTLRGSKTRDILKYRLNQWEYYGALKHLPEEAIDRYIQEGISGGLIAVSGQKYPKLFLKDYPKIKRNSSDLTEGSGKGTKRKSAGTSEKKTDPVRSLIADLKKFRDSVARKNKWKKFMVMQNAVIDRIARSEIHSIEDLLTVKGMGETRTDHLGREILEIINRHRGY